MKNLLRPRFAFLLSALALTVGCPASRAPVAQNGSEDAATEELAAPDSQEALDMIEQVSARVVKDENGNLTSVDFTDLAIRDDQVPLLKGLPKLKRLRLWGSEITDGVFDELVKLNSVVDLGIENADVHDEGIARLAEMKQLRTVYMRRNSYLTDKAWAVFRELPELTQILTLYCNFTDNGLEEIKNLTKLRGLDLRGCMGISDHGLAKLSNLTNLERLKMRTFSVTNDGMSLMSRLPNLKSLVMEDTPINAEGLSNIKDAKNLVELELLRTQVDDYALDNLANLTKLKKLSLRDNQINGEGFVHLKNAADLADLNVAETDVNDGALAHLTSLKNLTKLDLWNTQVTDAGMKSLAQLSNLKWLSLEQTGVTDAGIGELEVLSNLETLLLNSLQISDAGLDSLKKLKALKFLNLTYCDDLSEDAVKALRKSAAGYRGELLNSRPEGEAPSEASDCLDEPAAAETT